MNPSKNELRVSGGAATAGEVSYRRLVESAHDVIYRYRIAPAAGFEFVNRAVEKATGYSPDDLYADPELWYSLNHPDDQAKLARVLAGRATDATLELRWRTKQGEEIWTEQKLLIQRDERGVPVFIEAIVRDVSDRHKWEGDLRKLFRAVEQSPVSIVVTDVAGTIQYVNPKFERNNGYASSEVVGQNIRVIRSGEMPAEVYQELWKKILAGEVWAGELLNKKKNGEVYWASVTVSPVRDPKGTITDFVAVMEDISELKKSEEERSMFISQLRTLAVRLRTAREDERKSIAREIHDVWGQTISTLKIDLEWIKANLPPRKLKLRNRATIMGSILESLIVAVQKKSMELRPSLLDELGLESALEWQAEEFMGHTGIRTTFAVRGERVEIGTKTATVAFRICQEALTNVARHADASEVSVTLEEKQSEILLTVGDNGKGIEVNRVTDLRSIGLLGMKERAISIGGDVQLRLRPEGGTLMLARLPLEHLPAGT
jgi:PAS domain S-box-containing protein